MLFNQFKLVFFIIYNNYTLDNFIRYVCKTNQFSLSCLIQNKIVYYWFHGCFRLHILKLQHKISSGMYLKDNKELKTQGHLEKTSGNNKSYKLHKT